MAQYNVNPPDDYRRDTGMGTVLAVLLVLALVAFLIWALAFGGFNSLTGSPAAGPGYSTTTGATNSSGTTSGSSTTGTGATSGSSSSTNPSSSYGSTGSTSSNGSTTASGSASGSVGGSASTATKP